METHVRRDSVHLLFFSKKKLVFRFQQDIDGDCFESYEDQQNWDSCICSPSFPFTLAIGVGDDSLSLSFQWLKQLSNHVSSILRFMWLFFCYDRYRMSSSFLSVETDKCVQMCIFGDGGGGSFWKVFRIVFTAGQCSISLQFFADRQNKLPVSQSILSTCRSVDLPVSRPRLIDSWMKASGAWLTPRDYCSHMADFCQTLQASSCYDHR